MKYRKLRIAWSVGCGIAAVLLVVLSVRSSYSKADIIILHVLSTQVRIDSRIGFFAIQISKPTLSPKWQVVDFDEYWHSSKVGFPNYTALSSRVWGHFEFSRAYGGGCVPYWFPTLAFAALAVVPWLHWRFGLRSLLIATTLIAVVLGVVVYSIR